MCKEKLYHLKNILKINVLSNVINLIKSNTAKSKTFKPIWLHLALIRNCQ